VGGVLICFCFHVVADVNMVSIKNLFEFEDSNKHIIEEIVRQVGHPPELYEDARSEQKYKIL
jgi:hypothetical protein